MFRFAFSPKRSVPPASKIPLLQHTHAFIPVDRYCIHRRSDLCRLSLQQAFALFTPHLSARIRYKWPSLLTNNRSRTVKKFGGCRSQKLPYTAIVANRYRVVADLLLKQNRVAEAQQVLNLLKTEDIDNYFDRTKGTGESENRPVEVAEKPSLLDEKQQIYRAYADLKSKALALGTELTQLRQIPPKQRSRSEPARILEIDPIQQQLNDCFNQFFRRSDMSQSSNNSTQLLSEKISIWSISTACEITCSI